MSAHLAMPASGLLDEDAILANELAGDWVMDSMMANVVVASEYKGTVYYNSVAAGQYLSQGNYMALQSECVTPASCAGWVPPARGTAMVGGRTTKTGRPGPRAALLTTNHATTITTTTSTGRAAEPTSGGAARGSSALLGSAQQTEAATVGDRQRPVTGLGSMGPLYEGTGIGQLESQRVRYSPDAACGVGRALAKQAPTLERLLNRAAPDRGPGDRLRGGRRVHGGVSIVLDTSGENRGPVNRSRSGNRAPGSPGDCDGSMDDGADEGPSIQPFSFPL